MTNEMELESTDNTDVNEPSSEAQDDGSSEVAAKPAAELKQESIDWSKAFEHPRFKELVDQKNAALSQSKSLEQKLAQLEARFNQPAPQVAKPDTEYDSLIKDLKGIDPRLAAQVERHAKAAQTVEELQKRLEGLETSTKEQMQQATIKEAVGKVNQLHEANKVSPELKQLINDKLDLLYAQGKLDPSKIETEYKSTLDSYSKIFDEIKRAERASYVTDKKKDASVPTSQPKGTPAKQASKKPSWSPDKETARQQIVSRFLKQQAANRDADAV